MMRAPRAPLLIIDTKTGLCARYARKTKGLVAGVSDVQVDYVQVPDEWLPAMGQISCIVRLDAFRVKGDV